MPEPAGVGERTIRPISEVTSPTFRTAWSVISLLDPLPHSVYCLTSDTAQTVPLCTSHSAMEWVSPGLWTPEEFWGWCNSHFTPRAQLGDTARAPSPGWEWEKPPVLPPQLLGLNLAPGILRCEHSQLVEGVVWRLEWEGPGSDLITLPSDCAPPPLTRNPRVHDSHHPPQEAGSSGGWVSLYPLSLSCSLWASGPVSNLV